MSDENTLSDDELEAFDAFHQKKSLSDAQMAAYESAVAKTTRAKEPKPATAAPPPEASFLSRAGDTAADAVRGLGQGTSFGFGDELAGGAGALLDKAMGDPRGMGDLYRESRDFARKDNAQAKKNSPYAYGGAELAGSMAVPIPGAAPAKGAALLTKLGVGGLRGALIGGVSAAGNSSADLTKGEYGKFGKDVGKGTLIGGGVGLGTSALGAVASKIAAGAAAKSEKATQDALEQATNSVEEAISSAQGKARGKVQEASRDLEVLEREVRELPPGHPLREAAEQFLKSDDAMKMREMVVSGKLRYAPERIGEYATLDAEHAALAGSRKADIVAKQADILSNPVKKQLVPRLQTYLSRAIPHAVNGMIGGGVPGAVVGTGLAASMGHPGTALSNFMKSPAVRKGFADWVERNASGGGVAGTLASKGGALAARAVQIEGGRTTPEEDPKAFLAFLRSSSSGGTSSSSGNDFDTKLSSDEEPRFQAWVKQRSEKEGRDVSKDLSNYDLRGAWKADARAASNGHLPDTFKKPNHPTFSKESRYSGRDGKVGGEWLEGEDGKWEFVPSKTNLDNLGPDGLRKYFKEREPDARLRLQ